MGSYYDNEVLGLSFKLPAHEIEYLNAFQAATGQTYEEFVKTSVWEKQKAAFTARKGAKFCFVCRDPANLLHHRTYAQVHSPPDEHLVPLCFECHGEVHTRAWSKYQDGQEDALWDAHEALRAVHKEWQSYVADSGRERLREHDALRREHSENMLRVRRRQVTRLQEQEKAAVHAAVEARRKAEQAHDGTAQASLIDAAEAAKRRWKQIRQRRSDAEAGLP